MATNYGEQLQSCPFCGMKLVWIDEVDIGEMGTVLIDRRFQHPNNVGGCFLSGYNIPAHDAIPESGYFGRCAELWNARVDCVRATHESEGREHD